MATGHTHPVIDGEITTLSEFAYECSRSFVWSWRDGNGLRYPEDRTNHYLGTLKKHNDAFIRWTSMSEEEKYAEWSDYVVETEARRKEALEKAVQHRERVLHVLNQVKAVTPPETHENFHKFMVEQLEDTLNFDGDVESVDRWYQVRDFYSYCDDEVSAAVRMIEHYSKEVARARQNYADSVAWIDTLASTYGVKIDA